MSHLVIFLSIEVNGCSLRMGYLAFYFFKNYALREVYSCAPIYDHVLGSSCEVAGRTSNLFRSRSGQAKEIRQ